MPLYNIQDAQAPFVILQGLTSRLPWDAGVLLSQRFRTTALQVSASTLQFYPGDDLRFGRSWRAMNCSATTAALCFSRESGVALMGTAPVTTPRNVDALRGTSELLQAFDGVVCTSEKTGRSVGMSDVYTVSMCDLVEGALRFVMLSTQHGDQVFWIRENTSTTDTVVLSAIALFAATSLAQNLSSLFVKDHAVVSGTWRALNVGASIGSATVLFFMCETHYEYYVSQQDVALYIVLFLFVVVDIVLLFWKELGPRNKTSNFGHHIGLSTVLLLLVTLRLHNTFNTPFLLVLVGLFGTRASCKLLQHMHDSLLYQARDINLASVLADLALWCSLLAYSLAQCSELHERLAVAVNTAVALFLGLGMSVLVAERNADA